MSIKFKVNTKIIEVIVLVSIGIGWLGIFYLFPVPLVGSYVLFKAGKKISAFWSLIFGLLLLVLSILTLFGVIKSW